MQIKQGFTLIEMLLVLVVIALITLLGLGQYQRYTQTRNIVLAKNAVQSLFVAASQYYQNNCSQFYNLSTGLGNNTTITCPTGDTKACVGLTNFVNPFYSGTNPYLYSITVAPYSVPNMTIYLPVSNAIASNKALLDKYQGLLRASYAPCSLASGAAGCFTWNGTPANFGTVNTVSGGNPVLDNQLTAFADMEQLSPQAVSQMPATAQQQLQQACQKLEASNAPQQ
jgi:prepilin-type N-terminal cleavage/methylation domain-containing protein